MIAELNRNRRLSQRFPNISAKLSYYVSYVFKISTLLSLSQPREISTLGHVVANCKPTCKRFENCPYRAILTRTPSRRGTLPNNLCEMTIRGKSRQIRCRLSVIRREKFGHFTVVPLVCDRLGKHK
jgi:hypothetical protein